MNRLEILLIALIYNTNEVYPYQPTYQEFICTHLFLSVRISSFDENLFESLLIYDHL